MIGDVIPRRQHILDYGHDNRKGNEMYYITVKQSPRYHQMTLEEFLFGDKNEYKSLDMDIPITNTKTYEFEKISDRFLNTINVMDMIEVLAIFNDQTKHLHKKPRRELYREFYIPKKSGGLRKIDAPEPELKDALRRLKTIFEERFGALYHTTAFAYIKHRSIVDCVKRHQENESKWFGKYDLSNFFGSTTIDFVMNMFSMIFPFSEIIKDERGKKELETALSLAFLDGGLPQGTPVSPTITNIMMIPIDFKINKALVDFNKQRFVYTRYADDFIISSKYAFDFKEIEEELTKTLHEFKAPFRLNSSKTRYGSSTGRNWNLGIMLNKDNQITVGHKKKKQFQAMLSSYIMDKKNGRGWDKADIQTMYGYKNYYKMVEGATIDKIIEHIDHKFNVDVIQMIKQDLAV